MAVEEEEEEEDDVCKALVDDAVADAVAEAVADAMAEEQFDESDEFLCTSVPVVSLDRHADADWHQPDSVSVLLMHAAVVCSQHELTKSEGKRPKRDFNGNVVRR